ncbi:helicase RecD/TraA [Salpingoeca rosetta]|uniref:Helicase RecD/TraA n=1 Tax=Salpingoeca rosetta (strain ATCC 50818 / BSB-021) TaxID=946362 RepID=F2U1Z9_SALR5|nr:helicase RecD/TraA [Salpingoeca rosetta]EGD81651.1 helicase RecD/TraA [Salpingoeca rosetta]|eukprot:XP_004996855.1 helicase RecD/TraA [Salpingoeca rosetta]
MAALKQAAAGQLLAFRLPVVGTVRSLARTTAGSHAHCRASALATSSTSTTCTGPAHLRRHIQAPSATSAGIGNPWQGSKACPGHSARLRHSPLHQLHHRNTRHFHSHHRLSQPLTALPRHHHRQQHLHPHHHQQYHHHHHQPHHRHQQRHTDCHQRQVRWFNAQPNQFEAPYANLTLRIKQTDQGSAVPVSAAGAAADVAVPSSGPQAPPPPLAAPKPPDKLTPVKETVARRPGEPVDLVARVCNVIRPKRALGATVLELDTEHGKVDCHAVSPPIYLSEAIRVRGSWQISEDGTKWCVHVGDKFGGEFSTKEWKDAARDQNHLLLEELDRSIGDPYKFLLHFKGVKHRRALRIVEAAQKANVSVFELIESGGLQSIPYVRELGIEEKWMRVKTLRSLVRLMLLACAGLGVEEYYILLCSQELYEKFGKDAKAVLLRNPYCVLALDNYLPMVAVQRLATMNRDTPPSLDDIMEGHCLSALRHDELAGKSSLTLSQLTSYVMKRLDGQEGVTKEAIHRIINNSAELIVSHTSSDSGRGHTGANGATDTNFHVSAADTTTDGNYGSAEAGAHEHNASGAHVGAAADDAIGDDPFAADDDLDAFGLDEHFHDDMDDQDISDSSSIGNRGDDMLLLDAPQPSTVQRTRLNKMLTFVSSDLKKRASLSPPWDVNDLRLEGHPAIYLLSPSQQNAVKSLLRCNVGILTGFPGTGKTTLIAGLVSALEAANKTVRLVAPTGRAATRITSALMRSSEKATTIHSFARLGMYWDVEPPASLKPKVDDVDALIVDEASMLSVEMAYPLLKCLSPRTAIYFIGDPDQLPPIGACGIFNVAQTLDISPVRLTEVHRQQANNSRIQTVSREIASGRVEIDVLDRLPSDHTDFAFLFCNDKDIPTRVVELVTQEIPDQFGFDPLKDIQVLTPLRQRGLASSRQLNTMLQGAFVDMAEDKDQRTINRHGFRLSDKVIQTVNNREKDVYNGEMGQVVSIPNKRHHVLDVQFDRGQTSNLHEGDVIVGYSPFDLDTLALGYAITIHKAQGSEFPAVVIPLTMEHASFLNRNLLYTGVTRARRLVICVGQHAAWRHAINTTHALAPHLAR